MAKTIKVTPELLGNIATQIDSLAKEYKTEYEALFSDVDAMKGKWDGQDNVAFTTQINGFKDDYQNMYNLMIDYSNYLKTTKKSYEDTQTNIANTAKTLTN